MGAIAQTRLQIVILGLQQKEDQKVSTPIKLTKEEHIALTIQGPQKG